jgi:hypothetical protein
MGVNVGYGGERRNGRWLSRLPRLLDLALAATAQLQAVRVSILMDLSSATASRFRPSIPSPSSVLSPHPAHLLSKVGKRTLFSSGGAC